MRFCIDIGIDPQGHGCTHTLGTRHLVDEFKLGHGLYIETANTRLQRAFDFIPAFADTRKHRFRCLTAGCQYAFKFTHRYDVEARAQPGQQIEHGQVGIGLDRITDQVGMR